MKTTRILTAAAFASVAALGAAAQDSVSNSAGLPGDAVDPFSTGEQVNDYVVDLADLITSWGTNFGIAPVAKSGKGDVTFFNNGISAQGMSATVLTQQPTPRASYTYWNTPGAGVNPTENDAGVPLVPPPTTAQLAAVFSEYNGQGGNHAVTAIINVNHANPGRLFVSRIQSVVNGTAPFENFAQLGIGGVDADGNSYIRADDFGVSGVNPIVGNNYYRVDALARNGAVLNQLLGTGPTDAGASDWLVQASTTTHSTPTGIPEDIAGRPICIGTPWNATYIYEAVAGTMSATAAHLSGSNDTRGNVSFSKAIAIPGGGAVGTVASVALNGSSQTRNVQLWGVNTNGAVTGTLTIPQPASFTDNSDGFTFPEVGNAIGQYVHHNSQVSFRGGNGQVALGRDQAGRILAATTGVADDATTPVWGNGQQSPINAIFVWRFNPGGGGMTSTLAAYTDVAGGGKEILDGPGGTAIGRCIWLDTLTGGSFPGPSMSCPMIDSVGNVWFQAAIEIYATNDLDTALLRAVYDPSTFSYELELVAQLGQVFHGPNSDRDYQITFMGIADNNSIASNAVFSGNIVQSSFNDFDVSSLPTSAPCTLGGLVFNATVTYDYDDDGMFDPSAGSDQDYGVVLYLGPKNPCYASSASAYCTAGVSASGCTTNLSATGVSSSTASTGFTVTGPSSEGAKTGLFYWSIAPKSPATLIGTSSSYVCVLPPVRRSPLLDGGGTNGNCDGTFAIDMNTQWYTKPAQNPGAGVTLYGQLWYRDPVNTSNQTTSRSDAIQWTSTP